MNLVDGLPLGIGSYEIKVFIKDNGVPSGVDQRDSEWVDFSNRWDVGDQKRLLHKIGGLNQSTEGKAGVNWFQTSIQSVSFNNRPASGETWGFFDRPIPREVGTTPDDDFGRSYPTTLTTVDGNTAYFTLSKGYEQTVYWDRLVKVTMKIILKDLREMEGILGVFGFGKISRDSKTGLANCGLLSLSKRLQRAEAGRVKDGRYWHLNKPVLYLVRALLESVYGEIPETFGLPPQIKIETAESIKQRLHFFETTDPDDVFELRALSSFGRPPDFDGETWVDRGLIPHAMEIWSIGTHASGTDLVTSAEDYAKELTGDDSSWYKTSGIGPRPSDSIVIRGSANGNDGSYEIEEVLPGTPEILRLKDTLRGTAESGMTYSIVRIYIGLSHDVWAFNPETQAYRRVTTWDLDTSPEGFDTPESPDAPPYPVDYGTPRGLWYNENDDHLWLVVTPDLQDQFTIGKLSEYELYKNELNQRGVYMRVEDNASNEIDFAGTAYPHFGDRNVQPLVTPISNGNYIYHRGRANYQDKGCAPLDNNNQGDVHMKMTGTVVLNFDVVDQMGNPFAFNEMNNADGQECRAYNAMGENILFPFAQKPKYANPDTNLGPRYAFTKIETAQDYLQNFEHWQHTEIIDGARPAVADFWDGKRPGVAAGIDIGKWTNIDAYNGRRFANDLFQWHMPLNHTEGPEGVKLGTGPDRTGNLCESGYWAFTTAPNCYEDDAHWDRVVQMSAWWMFGQGQKGTIMFAPEFGSNGYIFFWKIEADQDIITDEITSSNYPTETPTSKLYYLNLDTMGNVLVEMAGAADIQTDDAIFAASMKYTSSDYPYDPGNSDINREVNEFLSWTCMAYDPANTDRIYIAGVAPTDYAVSDTGAPEIPWDKQPDPGGAAEGHRQSRPVELMRWHSAIVQIVVPGGAPSLIWESVRQGGVDADAYSWTILEMVFDANFGANGYLFIIGMNREGFGGPDPRTRRVDNRYFVGYIDLTDMGSSCEINIPSHNFWFTGQPQNLTKSPIDGNYYFTVGGSNTLWKLIVNDKIGRQFNTMKLGDGYATVDAESHQIKDMVLDPWSRGAMDDADDVWNENNIIVYGISRPSGPPETYGGTTEGKNYLWKYDRYYTTRVELADFSGMKVWDALGALAQLTDHIMGYEGEDFFFVPREQIASSTVTYGEFEEDGLVLKDLKVQDGTDEIYNYCAITPSEVVYQAPDIEVTIRGREENDPPAEFEFDVKQDGVKPKVITLRCVEAGPLGDGTGMLAPASFSYKITEEEMETSLSQAFTENDHPYRLYITLGIMDIEPGDEVDISWEDDDGNEQKSIGEVWGDINVLDGSFCLRNEITNFPLNGFGQGTSIIIRKFGSFSDRVDRSQFPHEMTTHRLVYPHGIWNTSVDSVVALNENYIVAYEQAHCLVLQGRATLGKNQIVVYHGAFGKNQELIETIFTRWHVLAGRNSLANGGDISLVPRYVDTTHYIKISLEHKVAGAWQLIGVSRKGGAEVEEDIQDPITVGDEEGIPYYFAVRTDGDDYDIWISPVADGEIDITTPDYTWTSPAFVGEAGCGYGKIGVGCDRVEQVKWDKISLYTPNKERLYQTYHFDTHPYRERIENDGGALIENDSGAYWFRDDGDEMFYQLACGDDGGGTPVFANPEFYVEVPQLAQVRRKIDDVMIYTDFMLKTDTGDNVCYYVRLHGAEVYGVDVDDCFIQFGGEDQTHSGNNLQEIIIKIGDKIWTSRDPLIDSEGNLAGTPITLDIDVKYRAKVQIDRRGGIYVWITNLDDLSDLNVTPVIFSETKNTNNYATPFFPYDFEGFIGFGEKEAKLTPDDDNKGYVQIHDLRVYPGEKSAEYFIPAFFPNEFKSELMNATFQRIGKSDVFIKMSDPEWNFWKQMTLKQEVTAMPYVNKPDPADPNSGRPTAAEEWESNHQSLSWWREGDIIKIQCAGWTLESKTSSQQRVLNLPSIQLYGRLEYPSYSNRFFTPRIAGDIAARTVDAFAFPHYIIVVNVLLDPRLNFLSEATNRRSVQLKHEKIFSMSPEFIRSGTLRKISHNPTTAVTSFVFRDLNPY